MSDKRERIVNEATPPREIDGEEERDGKLSAGTRYDVASSRFLDPEANVEGSTNADRKLEMSQLGLPAGG